MMGTVTLEIEVADANDNSPRFSPASYSIVVSEDTLPHTTLVTVSKYGTRISQINVNNRILVCS